MSIFICESCQKQIDSDFDGIEILCGEEVCQSCYDNYDPEPDYDCVSAEERRMKEAEERK